MSSDLPGDQARAVEAVEESTDELPLLVPGEPAEGLTGAVYGHPGGGALRPAPARVDDEIRGNVPDIYRDEQSVREKRGGSQPEGASDATGALRHEGATSRWPGAASQHRSLDVVTLVG